MDDYVDDDDNDDHDDDIDGDCSNGSLLCTASFSWYRIDGQSEVWKIVAKTTRKLRIMSSAKKNERGLINILREVCGCHYPLASE